MDLGLTGKVALVAGASKGLGFAVARAMAAMALLVFATRNTLIKAAQTVGMGAAAAMLFLWPIKT